MPPKDTTWKYLCRILETTERTEGKTMSEKQLLIVEDEKPIADILAYGFRREGFAVRCAYTGA